MNTTIRKEIARLWYALKIAAGTGPESAARDEVNGARGAGHPAEETPAFVESTSEGQGVTPASRQVESPEARGGSEGLAGSGDDEGFVVPARPSVDLTREASASSVAIQAVDAGNGAGKNWASGTASDNESDADQHAQKRASGRSPALVVLSRAGRSNVEAQHRRSLQADGRRPAYALPYSPQLAGRVGTRQGAVAPAAANSVAASAGRQGARGTLIDGDAGVVV